MLIFFTFKYTMAMKHRYNEGIRHTFCEIMKYPNKWPRIGRRSSLFWKILQKVNFLALFWLIIKIFLLNMNICHETKLYSMQTQQNATL